jgi:branched-chain amino acid aminotransferase
MSGVVPKEPAAPPRSELAEESWRARTASPEDIPAIAAAVRELLVELGGSPPADAAMQATARTLLDDGDAGALLVAEAPGALVGVLAASWQTAIHVPGRYGLIQDLWVHPSWRSRAVGAGLLAALFELAHDRQIVRVEVGLPQERFAGIEATEAFYRANGFAALGPRMRRVLS